MAQWLRHLLPSQSLTGRSGAWWEEKANSHGGANYQTASVLTLPDLAGSSNQHFIRFMYRSTLAIFRHQKDITSHYKCEPPCVLLGLELKTSERAARTHSLTPQEPGFLFNILGKEIFHQTRTTAKLEMPFRYQFIRITRIN